MNNEQKERIAVGIIGTGGMGTRHANNIHHLVDGAFISAIYDTDESHAAHASSICDSAQILNDPFKLIESPDVDAVLIASPDDMHTEVTLACIKAGKPVLCEKPLATTVEDARKVISAEVAGGMKLVSVGFMRRFDPQHTAVKEKVASGDLGLPLLWKGVHRNASTTYGISPATILTNSAGHDIDSARFLLGSEVKEVFVQGLRSRDELHKDTKDLLIIEMTMTDNCMAVGEVYVNAGYGYEVSAEVVCQKGTVVTLQPDKAIVRANSHRGFYVSSDWLAPFEEAYVLEDRNWIDHLRGKKPFMGADAWDGYVTMLVTAACIQSQQTGKIVPVQLGEKAEMYK